VLIHRRLPGTEPVTLSSALAAIVAGQYVLSNPTACAEYTIQGLVPACVVAPGSLEELAAAAEKVAAALDSDA